jgi:diaminopimelate epimerase
LIAFISLKPPTVLCTEKASPCKKPYGFTTIEGNLVNPAGATFEWSNKVESTCTQSTWEGKTEIAGGPLVGKLVKLSFAKCTCATTVANRLPWRLEIYALPAPLMHDGTLGDLSGGTGKPQSDREAEADSLLAVRFEKWQALGNDYVIVEADSLPWELTASRAEWICDPHFGVGSDGVLLLSRSEDPAFVAELRIFNPDGSEAELSGNGAREAILYLRRHGWTDADVFTIRTAAGPIRPTITSELTCSVDMGRAATSSKDFPSGSPDGKGTLAAAGRDWDFQHVSIGNPQCAIEVGDEVESLDLVAIGPEIEGHELFPNRTNVSIFKVDGNRVRARIFERGVGETLSSGTGAGGAAVTTFLRGVPSPIVVELDGGELEVEISVDLDVRLSGWAEPVYSGELSPELMQALAELT